MEKKKADLHRHQCEDCGTVWRHRKSRIPRSENDRWHACPKCGKFEPHRYHGDAQTDVDNYHDPEYGPLDGVDRVEHLDSLDSPKESI
jgi:predicted  nucleic acid-binding Zn-ribbon protein